MLLDVQSPARGVTGYALSLEILPDLRTIQPHSWGLFSLAGGFEPPAAKTGVTPHPNMLGLSLYVPPF